MPHAFDLLTEPWLPCLPIEGEATVLLSLPDALASAHQYREFVADTPLVAVGVHRLLLAIVHRAYMGPRTAAEWHALHDAGRFDAARIRNYLADPRWRSRFDLFDAQRPFYQVPQMEDTEPSPISMLLIESRGGNCTSLFEHTINDDKSLTPADAARYLMACQAYAVAGGNSKPFYFEDAPLARDYSVLLRGATLFETLLLNLLRYDDEVDHTFKRPLADDSAWWERASDPEPESEGTVPRGYCDYLTWQSRRVHLLYEEAEGVIRRCQVRQNLTLHPDAIASDPFKAYRKDAKGKRVSRRLNEAKAVWRDSHALLETAAREGSRPEVFQWLATLFDAGRSEEYREFAFEVIGYLMDKPGRAVILWRRDRLPLPLRYLEPEATRLRDDLRSGLEAAEEASHLFGTGYVMVQREGRAKPQPSPVWVLAKDLLTMSAERTPDRKDIEALAAHYAPARTYWAALELPFRQYLRDLAATPADGQERDEHYEQALTAWKEELRTIARRTFLDLTFALESDVRSLRAAALAERQFYWLLKEILPPAKRTGAEADSMEVRA